MSTKQTRAEKVLERAIAEATVEIRHEIDRAKARIRELEGLLARIGAIAAQGSKPIAAAPPVATPEPEPADPPERTADLAGEDNMGEGRWV